QSELINKVQRWATAKGDESPLQMVPTEYYNATETPYKKAIRETLDQQVVVQWTGLAVVPGTITKAQAAQARKVFGHQILVWDNYPVNDYNPGRIPLGDYAGREPGLSEQLAGIISNPMNQAAVSKIALYAFADFGWNDPVYDAQASWLRALNEVASGDQRVVRALRDFADLSTYDGTLHTRQSPALAAELARFAQDGDLARLRAYAERLRAAPGVINAGVKDQAFLQEAKSWLDAAELWSKALLKTVDVLEAVRAGDGAKAVQARQDALDLITAAKAIRDPRAPHSSTFPRIGDGVLDRFVDQALAELDRWIGVVSDRPKATTTLGTYGDNVPGRMVDRDPATFYWSSSSPDAGDSVGVDLGAVRAIGDVAVLMGKAGSPNDYLHAGALEYSADGSSWTQLATGTTAEVKATAPAGTKARYVRYRATANSDFWLVVREFQVATLDGDDTRVTVTGTPAGTGLAAAADGNLSTAWTASAAPAAGDALQAELSRARLIDKVAIVGSGSGEVQLRAGGQWQAIGRLAGPYTELDPADVTADAVRIAWTAGGTPPRIAEIVPRYADVPAVALTADRTAVDTATGTEETVNVGLSSQRAAAISALLEVTGPAGWELPAARQVTVPRGQALTLPVTFTPQSSGTLKVAFAGASIEVQVTAHRPIGTENLAKGRPVTASSVEGGTSFAAANAVDGDPATRWSSEHTDDEWISVDLGAAVDVGQVTLRWEDSYGKAYRVESSADGTDWKPLATVDDGDGGVDTVWIDQPNATRHLRVHGVKRALRWGYSLWELEVRAAR
ncbi:MAG: hypothetical protein HOY71_31360, partial [Nonomuraea sp.]|nr:hypothetical protein [Nonomuraea sp.]